jgi:predicted RNase H-like HicB family nuclease
MSIKVKTLIRYCYFYHTLNLIKTYLAIIERAPNNYGTFSSDVLGCVSSGNTVEETVENFREVLQSHFEMMLESGESIPEPRPAEEHVAAYRSEGTSLCEPEFI